MARARIRVTCRGHCYVFGNLAPDLPTTVRVRASRAKVGGRVRVRVRVRVRQG